MDVWRPSILANCLTIIKLNMAETFTSQPLLPSLLMTIADKRQEVSIEKHL